MKKFLLSMAAMTVAIGSFAEVYRVGDVILPTALTAGEHQVIFKVATKNAYGFLHAVASSADASQVYFGGKDMTMTEDSDFDASFVYTLNVGEDGNFTIMNSEGGYAPKTATNNVNASYYSSTPVEDAGQYKVLTRITTPAIKDDHFMIELVGATPDHLEVHLNGEYDHWTYFSTGDGGIADAGGLAGSGNTTRTACAFKMYKAEVKEDEGGEGGGEEVVEEPRVLVTNATVSTKIVDGAVITLQCKDKNGGDNYYFNGDALKEATLQFSKLFKVIAADGEGFYLQQIASGKFVGGSTTQGSLVQLVEEQTNANKFTAAIATVANWDNTKADDVVAGENTIRFSTANGMFLNTAETGNVPKYASGVGGFSVWYVYAYSAEGVLDVVLADTEAFVESMFKDDVPGFYPLNSDTYTAVTAANEAAKALADASDEITLDAVIAAREAIETAASGNVEEVALDGIFNGVYTITNKDGNGSRGYLCYIEDDDNRLWSSGKSVEGVTIPAKDDENSKWAFVEIDGKRYLFNVGVKKFIAPTGSDSNSTSNPWEFSNEKAGPITLVVSKDGAGSVEIRSVEGENDETCYMSISNNHNDPVAGYYTATDGGAPFVFERVSDLTEELRSEMETMKPTPTAIHEIGAVAEGTPEYYDLNGRRVAQPANGLFIMRQGNKVSKVIL